MKCNNCGAELKANSNVCPNCGTPSDDYYVLVSSDYEAKVHRKNTKSPKKSNAKYFINAIISFVLVLALVGGSYYYFQQKHINEEAPKLSFSTGTGVANDKKIVYLTIKDSSNIAFIQGVSIYDGDLTADVNLKKEQPLSTDYEYTKNSGDSFRSIFFYADEIGVEKSKNYTYTFELVFSFVDDNKFYTYKEPVTFSGDIKDDVSSIIFDHSLKDDKEPVFDDKKEEKTTDANTTTKPTTQLDISGRNFIISAGYWYTEPVVEKDTKSIEVWDFKEDKEVEVTTYTKTGTAKWQSEKTTYKYAWNNIKLYIYDTKDMENRIFVIRADPFNKTVVKMTKEDSEELSVMTVRNNNDEKTVEEFFK